MKTYFLTLKVFPTRANKQCNFVKGALASCWVLGNDPQSALAEAEFFVSKGDWEIEGIEKLPIEVTQNHFQEKDIGLQQYMKAQENGIAIAYAAWSKDGKTTAGPITLKPSYKFDISTFLKTYKKFQNQGRCLHYDANERCKEIINAHSIQRRKSLSEIAHNGHIYRLASDFSTLKKNKGKSTLKKKGVNDVSTFLGFCKKHDHELFKPIDNFPLIPTDQQIFLYAYRSLCRELFVKENSLRLIESQLNEGLNQKAIKKLLLNMRAGTALGLDNLKNHKSAYDNFLKEKSYNDIRYALFISKQKPFMAFSGLIYPDFDFMGRKLQNLENQKSNLDLITFCSSPMDTGWGFLFAWHKSSSNVCVEFMRSLATIMYEGKGKVEDMLFRLVISTCENHAISPQWWEVLSKNHKEQIIAVVSNMVNIFAMTKPTYLVEGLEGIANWSFKSVISNME